VVKKYLICAYPLLGIIKYAGQLKRIYSDYSVHALVGYKKNLTVDKLPQSISYHATHEQNKKPDWGSFFMIIGLKDLTKSNK
jgi:hypothetical protein